MTLNARQRKHLRGLAHALQPVVTVADKGLSRNVMAEIESALDHHELVKIKFRTDRDTRAAWAEEVASRAGPNASRPSARSSASSRNTRKPAIALPE
jgi:RNA-binding protein